MRLVVLAGTATMLVAGACRGGSTGAAHRTEHERDSILGQSSLPGARGVRGALDVGDSARVRNGALDSAAAVEQ